LKIERFVHWSREKLPAYRYAALLAVGAFLIIGTASQLGQWLEERTTIHLVYGLGLLVIACSFFLLVPERMMVIIGALFTVVLLGLIGTVANQTLSLVPLILLCGLVAYVLLRWQGHNLD
jgi:hypothetical protein